MKVQQYFMMIIIHVTNRKISKVIKCKSDFPFSGANYVTPEKEKDIVSIQLGYAIYFLNTSHLTKPYHRVNGFVSLSEINIQRS